LANSYPLLFNSSDDSSKNEYRVNFFKATEKTSYFLDISGGATDFKRFILRYQEQKKRFEKFKPKHPVIMLLDNDSGPKDLLNHLKDKVKIVQMMLILFVRQGIPTYLTISICY
ncbi:hypothetical protein DDB45_004316, partial [Escherichia coli]|nr:hypothetical protein [Escherichia coli]